MNILSKWHVLSGRVKFSLIWDAAFMLFWAFAAVALHDALALVVTILFAALLLVALSAAKMEIFLAEEYEKVDVRSDE